MSIQNAKNALALIDQVNAGTGAYTDANIAAVANVKTWLRQIAAGQLVVVDPAAEKAKVLAEPQNEVKP